MLSKKEAKPFMGKPNVLSFNKPLNSVVNIGLPQTPIFGLQGNATLITPNTPASQYKEIGYFFNPNGEKVYYGQRVPIKNSTKRSLFLDSTRLDAKQRQTLKRDQTLHNKRLVSALAAEGRRLENIRNAERVQDFDDFTQYKRRGYIQSQKYPKRSKKSKTSKKRVIY